MGEAARSRFFFSRSAAARGRAVDPTLAGEEKSSVGQQQRLTGKKNVPSAALHQRCLQKSCERIRNARGLEFFRALNLFQRIVNSESDL